MTRHSHRTAATPQECLPQPTLDESVDQRRFTPPAFPVTATTNGADTAILHRTINCVPSDLKGILPPRDDAHRSLCTNPRRVEYAPPRAPLDRPLSVLASPRRTHA